MPERAQQILRYLHDCYRADNWDLSIFNVFASKVEYRHMLSEPDELLSDALPEVPVAEAEFYDVQKTAALHRQEKELLLGTLLLTGYVRENGKVRKICAPLLTFPAAVKEDVATPMLAADLDSRRVQYPIYGSLAPGDPWLDGLLRRYLEHVASPRRREAPPAYADDPFLAELREELERRGFTTWPASPVAGFRVDLVVERDGSALGVDLVGYPGEYAGSFEIERYRLWNRAGLTILSLPYSAWRLDQGACLPAVEDATIDASGWRTAS